MFYTFNHEPLTVDLPDLIKGLTVMKRKAVLNHLLYVPKNKQVTISWQEQKFSKNDDGSYGDLESETEKVLTAKDIYFVDVTNGSHLCDAAEQYSTVQSEPDADGNTTLIQILNPVLENKIYAGEFDFYDHLANKAPVIINQLITQRILQEYQ